MTTITTQSLRKNIKRLRKALAQAERMEKRRIAWEAKNASLVEIVRTEIAVNRSQIKRQLQEA